MNEDHKKVVRVRDALERALNDWTRHGNEQPLTRWLERQLDPRGVLVHLPISEWQGCVNRLLRASSDDRAWPASLMGPITRLVHATRWFARRAGEPVIDFEPSPRARGHAPEAARLSTATRSNGRAVDRMIERIGAKSAAPRGDDARTAWGGSNVVFEVLRPGWPSEHDFLAVDHRDGKSASRFELFGAGRSWLGPTWKTEAGQAATSAPRPGCWISQPAGTFAEWSYRAGEVRITQSALLLANRSLALLSMLIEYPAPRQAVPAMSVSLWPEITPALIENCRGFTLNPANHRGSAQVLPIGLPSLPYPTERGAFLVSNDALVVKQASAGRRVWLPLVVSWDAKRHRKDVYWRVLSVSEKSRNVAPDRAFAARVSWGRGETYIIYHSLAKPAQRAFLGHPTTARFLLGTFNRAGVVEPIFKVD